MSAPPVASESALGLTALLGGSLLSLGTSAIAPTAAHAYIARSEISLTRQGTETYTAMLRRAEAIARAAAQRSFDSDVLVSSVSITVVGQNSGAIAPVFRLDVNRNNWRRQPDPQQWSTYFPISKLLLGFE
ncbi:MAG: hypothetical protein HC838_03595 [Spirulinaceae cyanobacterium RM2_2_10]|nr:hypothetical protein [Spirulinaceae cyanobacterium RM2_2_10]